jgi:hypothetical protein
MKKILIITLLCFSGSLTVAWAQASQTQPQVQPQAQVQPPQTPAQIQPQPQVQPQPQAKENTENSTAANIVVHVKNDAADDDDTNYFSITLPEKSESALSGGKGFAGKLFKNLGKRTHGMQKLSGAGSAGTIVYAPAFIMDGWGSGYAIDIGGRGGNSQYMGNVSFAAGIHEYMYIGGGFVYEYYIWTLQNMINLVPGITAGYWYESWTRNSNNFMRSTDSFYDFYVGGPSVKLEFGFGRYHLFAREKLLFGSSVNWETDFGLVLLK